MQSAAADFQKRLGARVREIRTTRGFSQESLAARAGIHRTYVSSIELGKVRLGLDVAKKVADGLGVELSDLLARAEAGSSRGHARAKRKQDE